MPDVVTGIYAVGTLLAAKSASDANKKADKRARTALEFQQQQYYDWKRIFGPVERNLSDYYSNLSQDQYVAQNLESFQTELQKATDQMRTQMEQRGLYGSGVASQAEETLALQKAVGKAGIRVNAPADWAKQQEAFLATGEGMRQTAVQGYGNALNQSATVAQQQADQSAAATGKLLSLGMQNFTQSDWFKKNLSSSPTTSAATVATPTK